MVKQMDEMVRALRAAYSRCRRIMNYWRQLFIKMAIAITLPIWLIPYVICRRK